MYRGALSVWGGVVWSPTVQSRATFGGHDVEYDDDDNDDDVGICFGHQMYEPGQPLVILTIANLWLDEQGRSN